LIDIRTATTNCNIRKKERKLTIRSVKSKEEEEVGLVVAVAVSED